MVLRGQEQVTCTGDASRCFSLGNEEETKLKTYFSPGTEAKTVALRVVLRISTTWFSQVLTGSHRHAGL